MAMLSGLLAGCVSARDTLGTNSSPCFRALPVAKGAVEGRGTFTGVRLLSASTVAKHKHLYADLTQRSEGTLHDVCVVSYRGEFDQRQVKSVLGKSPAGGTGHFAIVFVSRTTNKLLGTFVLVSEPVRFRHLAMGASLQGAGGVVLSPVAGGSTTVPGGSTVGGNHPWRAVADGRHMLGRDLLRGSFPDA